MSILTVGWMVDLVEKKILDEGNDDFSEAELIGFYNLTLRLIVSLVPRAYTITDKWLMSPGIFQSIPSDGIKLVSITMNKGTDGLTYGSPVTPASLDALRSMCPTWATDTAAQEIEHFIRIPDMDASFYVYPQSDGTGYIEGAYAATPPTVVYDEADDWRNERIPLSDEFVPAIPDGMLFHAYDDDTDIPGNTPRSQLHYQRVLSILGIKSPQVRSAQAQGVQQ